MREEVVCWFELLAHERLTMTLSLPPDKRSPLLKHTTDFGASLSPAGTAPWVLLLRVQKEEKEDAADK
jgi:hypothetical protein